MSLVEQDKTQHPTLGPARRINGRFAKGYSGNPAGHATFAARQADARKHAQTLLKALLDELAGKVSAVDLAFAEQACALLAKAQYSEKHRAHLTRQAHSLIDKLRERYPRKARRIPTLKELGLE